MRRPRKRPFQRRDGMLRDQYRGLDGVEGILIMPRWMYGEPMSVADRDARRAEIGGDDTIRASRAMWAISDERSRETLEQLLIALAKGNFAAPGSLVPYADDPRVQPALLEALRTVPLEDLANHAQALGRIGGPGARDVLRARLREALADRRTFAPDSFFNSRAGSAVTCAVRLLDLDADDQEAAAALVRLIDHVCAFNRESAAWQMADVVRRRPDLHTPPLRTVRAALVARIDAADDKVFSNIAPALWNEARVQERTWRLLAARSLAKQQLALRTLSKVDHGGGGRRLIEWASRPRDPIFVLTSLGPNLRLLPDSRRAEIARRGLADPTPAHRYESAALLASLDKAVAARIARAAAKDEPDPLILGKLAVHAKPPGRRVRRARKRR